MFLIRVTSTAQSIQRVGKELGTIETCLEMENWVLVRNNSNFIYLMNFKDGIGYEVYAGCCYGLLHALHELLPLRQN